MDQIILASSSPRRREILDKTGIPYRVISPGDDELMFTDAGPIETAEKNALLKAESVRAVYHGSSFILSADTVVDVDDRILGKPEDDKEAYEMLSMLAGRWHEVVTGFCIVSQNAELHIDHVITRVKFRKINKEEIIEYIKTGEPFDKAGAYGIQGRGGLLVEKIDGCYFNVMGLPISKIFSILRKYEVDSRT